MPAHLPPLNGPLDYLASLEFFGVKLGLERINALVRAAGNPHLAYPIVHIAGTNGKGSVLAILAAILRASGYTTGRFTSPHILDVTERFLVNAAPIPQNALCEHIAFFRESATTFDAPPTYFELCTAIAFRHFAQERVDIALIETGMGGRLDSTNIVQPLATAITNIDFDHMRYLGDTLEAIAAEKAGIVKPGVPLVTGEENPLPLAVIENTARIQNAPCLAAGRDFSASATGPVWNQRLSYAGPLWQLDDAPLRLAGRHQAANAAVAITLAGLLQPQFPNLSEQTVRDGLANAVWPCRLECVLENPPVILDAAHNAPGARRLAQALGKPCVLILAVSQDKDARTIVETLAPHADPLILTTFDNPRARTLASLRELAGNIPCRQAPGIAEALEEGLERATQEKPLLLTGSIFAVAEARKILCEKYAAPKLTF